MPSLSIWNQQFEQIDFYDLSCGLKCTQVIFNFLIYNTFINHISQFFSSHLFMMGSLIFDILYGYFLIFSWFNATVPAYWKHLPSPLTELNVACFLSSQENIYMIHHNSYLFYGICNIINKNIDKITTFNWCFSNDLISRKKWFTELFANFICFTISHNFYIISLNPLSALHHYLLKTKSLFLLLIELSMYPKFRDHFCLSSMICNFVNYCSYWFAIIFFLFKKGLNISNYSIYQCCIFFL